MFTGIVEDLGTVRQVVRRGADSARFEIATALDLGSVKVGDSIAVDGCCLTVVALVGSVGGPSPPQLAGETFEVDAAVETLRVTTLGERRAGDPVHLERALRVGDRLGGHIVSGHVDTVGIVDARVELADAVEVAFEVPAAFLRHLVVKGSVAVDGVSLTVNVVDDTRRTFSVVLIPHTMQQTHLAQKGLGARVNLEGDLIGKYVERLVKPWAPVPAESAKEHGDLAFLQGHGVAKNEEPRD